MDFFKHFFGSRNDETFHSWDFPEQEDQDESEHGSRGPRRNFDVFSDPIEIHRYFEEEINQLLRSFGLQGFGEFQMPNMPSLEDSPHLSKNYSEDQPQALRDQFLKKGYEKPIPRVSPKVDEDLDDKVKSGNLDALLKPHENQVDVAPHSKQNSVNMFMGKSQTMRTIAHPDGSIETEHTTRDSNGNQETTVCHKLGDKEYCSTRRVNKEGKEELTEQFINMDESEKNIFMKSKGTSSNQPFKFPFDKFFR